jgi:hypothetical protein
MNLSNEGQSDIWHCPGADPGNSERGCRDSFGKNPYTGMWKIYEIFWEHFFKSNSLPVNIKKFFLLKTSLK